MSRRICEDFNAFAEFLSGYNLTSYTSVPQQVEACKGMHKKLFGLLVFNAEFKVQGSHPDSVVFLEEMASDLLLSLFCVVQGLYKPAKLQLRCSMENFLKSLIMINTPAIIQEKSVYAIFDAAKDDSHFGTLIGQTCVDSLHNDYATLCRTVHGDPKVMKPTSALSMLPQYDKVSQQEVSSIYVRTIESCLGVLYLNFPAVVDQMHPDNKKDFLDCLAKTTKGDVVNTLYDD